jgi:hypothetical protein
MLFFCAVMPIISDSGGKLSIRSMTSITSAETTLFCRLVHNFIGFVHKELVIYPALFLISFMTLMVWSSDQSLQNPAAAPI